MSLKLNSKEWIGKLHKQLFDDVPLIVFVILIQALTAAMDPNSGYTFHFAKMIFIFALLKAYWLGIATSLLSFNQTWIKYLALAFHIFLFDLYLYLTIQFNVRLTPNVMALVLQTNPQETAEFFQSYFPVKTIMILAIMTIAIFSAYYFTNRIWQKLSYKIRIKSNIIAVCALIIAVFSFYTNTLVDLHSPKPGQFFYHVMYTTTLPHNDIYLSFKAVGGNEDKVMKIKYANDEVKIDSCLFSSPNIVFVIGESFIKSHSSLYGYKHDTTPYMCMEYEKSSLFVFTDVISHSAGTGGCMQYFYSNKSIDDDKIWEEQPLFPAIFKKAGYNVSLIDNQNTRSSGTAALDYTTSFFINPIDIHKECFDYRNEKVYHYDLEMIKAEGKHIKGNKALQTLTIIHLYGQHMGAESRYPNTPEYTFFSCDSIKRKELDKEQRWRVAHYDNATRYNDCVLNEIFNLYRNKDAVVVYVSDHGECVFDDSSLTYGRTISTNKPDETIKLLYEVPMVIWCSDKYKENHPEIVERIRKSVDRPFMHDDICHVLFDLAGIYTSHYNPSRSVINDKFKARQRFVNDGQYNYDINKSRLDKVQLRTKDN